MGPKGYKSDGEKDLTMNPRKFWYIKLRDYGDRGERKMPLESWGGYSQDFSDADRVYSWEETQSMSHGNFGIVGYRQDTKKLIVVDMDCDDIEDFDDELLGFDPERVPYVRSIKPDGPDGYHGYYLVDRVPDESEDDEIQVEAAQSWVDIKGQDQGHVVSPFHESEWYEELNDIDEPYRIHDHDEINVTFTYDNNDLVELSHGFSGDSLDIPSDPPRELPNCLHQLLQHRRDLDRHVSEVNPWYLDSAVGRRLVAFGYDLDDAMSLLREYPPQDGFDPQESRYQLRVLYQKELHPDSRDTLEDNGISLGDCGCQYCSSDKDLIARQPSEAEDWTVEADDTLPNIAMPSIARTGKSYTMVGQAAKLLKRDQFSDKRIVYVSSAHSEAEATVEKFKEHGITDVSYLVGRERARKEYNISSTGEFRQSATAKKPEEAAKLNNCDQYLALQRGCKDAQVVVTVPEKLDDIGDRDWLIMTEEAAFSRILSTSVNVIDIERHMGTDRLVRKKLSNRIDRLQAIEDYINDLDQLQPVHRWVRTTVRKMLQISRRIDNWLPSNWSNVEQSWDSLTEDVQQLLDDIAFEEEPNLEQARSWLTRFQDMRKPILNVMFSDGINTYENDEKKQMFIVGDCHRLFVPLPDDCSTFWTAGNSLPHMEHFHELSHGDDYEVKPFLGGVTPVQDCIRVIRYTGGENQNQQANHVQQSIEQFRSSIQHPGHQKGGLIISGSSEHCASHARRIGRCTTPSQNDDLATVRHYLDSGELLAIPENSRYSEGVDTPESSFGALYNGNFATPREDYMEAEYGRDDLKKAEKIRAAQNSILRPSDVLEDGMERVGTGVTPVIVPDMHVPDEIWELFEEYGVEVWEQDEISDVRRLLIAFTELEEELEVHEGRIMHVDDTPTEAEQFKQLIRDQASDSSETAD